MADTRVVTLQNDHNIDALELLRLSRYAAANADAKGPFRTLLKKLDERPQRKQSLAFEFVKMGRELVRNGDDPGEVLGWANAFLDSVKPENTERFAAYVYEVTSGAFESLGQHPPNQEGSRQFLLAIMTGAACLKRIAPRSYYSIVAQFEGSAANDRGTARRSILERVKAL